MIMLFWCWIKILSKANPPELYIFFFLLFVRFDAVIISSEVGYEKPDAKIFLAALGI